MRRLRESGIVTILLLGLTGCAGVQQRLGWTEPPYLGDKRPDESPLSRLAFWRRHRAEEASPATSTPEIPEPGRTPIIAGNGSATGDDEGRPGLLRRLPIVGRLWKGDSRDESDDLEMPAARYASGTVNSRSVALTSPRTGTGGGGPAQSRAASTGESSPASPGADARTAATSPTPSPTTASAGSDPSEEPPLRELSVDLAGTRPQMDPAAVPAGNPGSPPPVGAPASESAPPVPSVLSALPQQRNLPEPPPVPSLGREAAPTTSGASTTPSASPGPQPNLAAPDLSPSTTGRGPSLPSPTITSQPESGANPASESWSPSLVSTPGPVWPATNQSTFVGSSQSLVMPSSQGEYASGGCETPCGPKCKTHKLCPLKKHRQAVIANSAVLPSGQGTLSSCEASAPCKVKKECFLKRWLHHKSGCKAKGCKGCRTCSYCGEPAAMVSAQAPMVSAQW